MIVILRSAPSGKPVGVNIGQIKFLRANAEDVTAVVFGKTGDEHMVLVKGSLMQVALELNRGFEAGRRVGDEPPRRELDESRRGLPPAGPNSL